MSDPLEHCVELLLCNEPIPVFSIGIPIANVPVDLIVEVVLHWRDVAQHEETRCSTDNDLAHLRLAAIVTLVMMVNCGYCNYRRSAATATHNLRLHNARYSKLSASQV
jgi:hypothetical protein